MIDFLCWAVSEHPLGVFLVCLIFFLAFIGRHDTSETEENRW